MVMMGEDNVGSGIQRRVTHWLLICIQTRMVTAVSFVEYHHCDIHLFFQFRYLFLQFADILLPDKGVNLCWTARHIPRRNVAGFYFYIIGSRLLGSRPAKLRACRIVRKHADFQTVFFYNGRLFRLHDIGTAPCRVNAKLF